MKLNKLSNRWFPRTNRIHDLDRVGGGAWPADASLVLGSDSEDILLVLHHIIQRGRAVVGIANQGCLPFYRGPVTELDHVGSDLRATIELGRLPGDGGTKFVHCADCNVLRSIRNI